MTDTHHLFLPDTQRGLFNPKAAKVYPELIILTESVLDSLSLIHAGIENTMPCYGTNGFTELLLKTLKDARVQTICIAFDSDTAGHTGSDNLKATLLEQGFAVKQVYPERHKDWNQWLSSGGMTKEEVLSLIEKAPMSKPEARDVSDFRVKEEGRKYITYRILGVKKLFVTNLRVNIRAEYDGMRFPDNVDLCSSRSRSAYSQILARMFEIEVRKIENDLIRIMDYFEKVQEKELERESGKPEVIEFTEEERKQGFQFLKSKNLFNQISEDMTALGYVNEDTNKLIVYIAAMSRFMKKPLSVYIQSGSSGGKSALLATMEMLILPSDIWKATTISAQAFNYVEQQRFLGKVFFMGESIHDEAIEGLVRQMQSEGEISRLVTVKDEKTGEMRAQLIRKKVRMSFMVTSTALHLNQENASRCLILTADESKTQTQKVQKRLGFNHDFEGVVINPEQTKKIPSQQAATKH
jgi:DNA primase